MSQVLVLGGRGRIGQSVVADLLCHTSARIVATGRAAQPFLVQSSEPRVSFCILDLSETERLKATVAESDLVVHCAGPFRQRDTQVLEACIDHSVNYLDVSDDRSFTQKALQLCPRAQSNGTTAIVNSGIFPGISNSMVRLGVEQIDTPEAIHLSYVVSGSGGAGITVMHTTFLGLQHPFEVKVNGQWKQVQPYSEREVIDLPAPYDRSPVYWFDMPETFTLAASFPVHTVITKFGSVPDFYNHLTWMAAHWMPKAIIQHPATIAFLAKVSYRMTAISDRFTGTGVAILARVSGRHQGQSARFEATLVHPNTAIAAGNGTGSIAQLLLSGELNQPGVWSPEQALSTALFERTLQERRLTIQTRWI